MTMQLGVMAVVFCLYWSSYICVANVHYSMKPLKSLPQASLLKQQRWSNCTFKFKGEKGIIVSESC